jgi:hypothetical protein
MNEENSQEKIEDFFINERNYIKEKVVFISRNKVINIPILDYLYSKDPLTGSSKTALSGVITLDVNEEINQFDLYAKYKRWYPNVSIETTNTDNVIRAYSIQFYNIENITDDSEPYYTVLTDGNYNLSDLVSSDGPAGVALNKPIKSSTDTVEYEFSGQWKVYGTDDIIKEENFDTYIPETDMKLVPIYKSKERKYNVTFYDYRGEKINFSELEQFTANTNPLQYTYDQKLGDHETPILYLHREDDDDLPSEDWRYSFKGWISKEDFNALKTENYKPTIIDPEEYKVVKDDIDLYPYYVAEDASITASDLRFF